MEQIYNLPKEQDPNFQKYRDFVYNLEGTKDKDIRTRLDHAITGLCSESGELAGLMKKIKFFEAKIPKINFLDELGDILWYLTDAMNVFEINLEDLIRLNMTKLRARHPDGFTNETALNKNKDKEQKEVDKVTGKDDEISMG